MKNILIVFALVTYVIALPGCTRNKANMEVADVDGMKVKTFYNEHDNIEVILITDGNTTLAAQPMVTMARARKMSDEEYKCLKACKNSDGSFDMNCVLKCPVTKQLKMVTF